MFSLINFGALIAFTVVNLAVILHFAIRRREVKTAWQIVRNIVLPAIGVVLTVVLWLNVSSEAMIYGLIWLAVGFIALLVMTRLFRRRLHMSLQEDEVIAEGDEGPDALLEDDRQRLNAGE